MAIKSLNPYLIFSGKAEKAIKHYETALGAKADKIMRFGDIPGGGDSPPEAKNRVMHCVLHIGSQVVMVSDSRPGEEVPPGGPVHISVDFDDEADMATRFEALSAGGKVNMPLADTFWGARFGMLTDAYGIEWMFNCEKKK
jgi:PhnB protein